MKLSILSAAEDELESAFDYYASISSELGARFLEEYRRALERILEFPEAWEPFGKKYRLYRFSRFPYGIIHRLDSAAEVIVLESVSQLQQNLSWWKAQEN